MIGRLLRRNASDRRAEHVSRRPGPGRVSGRGPACIIAACLVSTVMVAPTASAQARITLGTVQRQVHGSILGFNEEYLSALNATGDSVSAWRDPDVLTAMRELHPSVLRFPGGTVSDFYDWQTEKVQLPIDNPAFAAMWQRSHKPRADQSGFFLMCDSVGADPLLVLNLYQGSSATLAGWVQSVTRDTSAHARLWELGNEMNLHPWHPAFHWATRVRTVAQYLAHAEPVGRMILASGAEERVAVDADEPEFVWSENPRVNDFAPGDQWNSAVASAPRFFNAVAMHVYLGDHPDWVTDDISRAQWLFEVGDELPGALNTWQQRFFGNLPLWLTEFGVTGRDTVEQTRWGFALPELNAALRLMATPGQVTMLLKHEAFAHGIGRVAFRYIPQEPEGRRVAWTATGVGYRWLGSAFAEATAQLAVRVSGPTFAGHLRYAGRRYATLAVVGLETRAGVTLFIVNRGAADLATVFPPGEWDAKYLAGGPRARVDSMTVHPGLRIDGGGTWSVPGLAFVVAHKN